MVSVELIEWYNELAVYKRTKPKLKIPSDIRCKESEVLASCISNGIDISNAVAEPIICVSALAGSFKCNFFIIKRLHNLCRV